MRISRETEDEEIGWKGGEGYKTCLITCRKRPTMGGQDDTFATSEYPRSATMFGGI